MSTPEPELGPGGSVLEPGAELLPGYRVVALLRRGHRLDVYDVWSVARASRCVVKVVRPDRRHEQHVVDDLLQEGELLTRLDHPHWVRAYEVVTDPQPAVVLETVGGTTLAALLDQELTLRPADVVLLGTQVGSALRYLHHLGWLHLDLTPTNVIIEAGRARLLDLSLASRPGPIRRDAGTSGYRAPEARAGRQVTTAADVWALGTLMRECLTGQESLDDDGTDEAPTWPRRRWPRRQPPVTLRDLVDAACLPDAARRPSLDEVLATLDELAASRGRGHPSMSALSPMVHRVLMRRS